MVSLLDIAPVVDTVDVNGEKVSIPGISIEGLVSLLQRYPVLLEMLNSGITSQALLAAGPGVAAAVIAAGCGQPGNIEVEKIATKLNLTAQVELLDAIIRRTMPKGIGPFVEIFNRVTAMVTDPVDLIKAKIEQMKASPKPLKPSSDGVVTPLKMSGP